MQARLILLFTAAALLRGQDATFSTDVKVVNVLATVRGKHGQIVRNLEKDDFTLAKMAGRKPFAISRARATCH